MARYGISTKDRVIGVRVSGIQQVAEQLGRDHDLAAALWKTGVYEARMLTAFVDDPALVTPEQMDRWTREFDNWAICDTLCFKLFDQTPHAFAMVDRWADDRTNSSGGPPSPCSPASRCTTGRAATRPSSTGCR